MFTFLFNEVLYLYVTELNKVGVELNYNTQELKLCLIQPLNGTRLGIHLFKTIQ